MQGVAACVQEGVGMMRVVKKEVVDRCGNADIWIDDSDAGPVTVFDDGDGTHRLVVLIPNRGVSMDALDVLSREFDTREINITQTDHGYYGDIADSRIVVTVDDDCPALHTTDESEEILMEYRTKHDRRRIASERLRVIAQARALGLKVTGGDHG